LAGFEVITEDPNNNAFEPAIKRGESSLQGLFQAKPGFFWPLLRVFSCYQSTITMSIGARLTAVKLTLLPRSGTASRTADSEYLF
jgi:hypothetical protein